jgi:hypothetical protein
MHPLKAALAVGIVSVTISLHAQSDLNAPAPRTPFDDKPDLSGVWQNVERGDSVVREELTLNDRPYATLADIGLGYRIGLPLQPWAALLKSMRMKSLARTASDRCLSLGNQQSNAYGVPRKIVHAPGVIAIVYDRSQGSRQVFTDGRPRRNEGTQPFSRGYSRGAWQGDTLVVLTTNFRDDGWLDMNGSPLTAAGRTIERFNRVNVGTIEVEQTIDDPKAYTRPFTTRLTWKLMPDRESLETVCR